MGCSIGHKSSFSSYDYKQPCNCYPPVQSLPNPNPQRYTISGNIRLGRYLLVDIIYPDCTNYEGRKILLYRDVTIEKLIKQGSIDPHFSNNSNFHSPIARFEPTEDGMDIARSFMVFLHGG